MLRNIFWVLVLVSLFVTSGCENKKELNELGIVLGMALDQGDNENIKLSLQVAKPGQMKGGEEGGGGKGGGSFILLSGEGKTVFDAIRNLDTTSSKRLFFSHNQVVIVGEKLAKEGLQQVVDFIERDTELRVEVPLLIARGEAGKILELPGNFEKLQAIGINKTLDTAELSGRTQKLHLYDFLRNQFKENYASVIPCITTVQSAGQEMAKISGLAVLKNGRLAGWLNDDESRGYFWVIGKVKTGIIVVPDQKGTEIALEIKEVKSKIDTKIKENQPTFIIKVNETSNLGEVKGAEKIAAPGILAGLEKKQAKLIGDEIKASLKKAKEMHTDIFGFGEELHRNYPKQWKKLKSSWDQKFPELNISISVKSNIQDFGEKTDPTFAHQGGR